MSFLDATGLGTFWGKLKNYFVSKDNFYTDIPDGLCHNSIYREKDITADYLSGKVSTNIANGTFHDIFPGDRITLNNRTYVVGGLNYYYNKGNDVKLKTNHILMFPLTHLAQTSMNSSNDTTGAYRGSEMYTALASTASGSYYATISGDFGASHMLKIPALLSIATVAVQGAMVYDENYPGRSSNWGWTQENLVFMSESQVYGTVVNGSSKFDLGEAVEQIPAFALNGRLINTPLWFWWLRGVASGRGFCVVSPAGVADVSNAASLNLVRPLFLIK